MENNILSNLSQYQSLTGTGDIEIDAVELTNALEEIQGSLLAKQEIAQKEIEAAREIASEKVEEVKRNLVEFIDEVFPRLEKNEKRDRRIALILYTLAVLFLAAAVLFSVIKVRAMSSNPAVLQSVEQIVSNILTLAIVVALSRLSFTLGKAFITNSLRSGDRIHAISFGKFFIQAYGDEASRDEIRAVFSEWNIDTGTSFHTQATSDYDPNILSALEIIKEALPKKTIGS